MSCLDKARAAWGAPPAWIVALAAAADAPGSDQAAVARRIGVSPTAVRLLITNRYVGRTANMQARIETALAPEIGRVEEQPDWVRALAEACRHAPQAEVGRRIGYSPAVVSQVVSGTYKGSLRRVEMQVRGVLMGAEVVCPTIEGDPIGMHVCVWNQELHFDKRRQMPGMSHRFRAVCPTCPNFLKARDTAA